MSQIKKTLILFSISLSDSFKANRRNGKLKILFPLFLISLYLLLFVVSFQYSISFMGILKENNLEYIAVIMFYLAAVIVMLMMTAYKARGALFGAKDTDMLLSMPINNSSILMMRIFNMMFFNYLIGSLLMIPPTIAYSFTYPVNWIYLILGLIFIPFIPTMIACCIGCIIGVTISKSRHKSIIEAIMSFLFIFIIFGVIANFGSILENIFEMNDSVILVFKKIYYPIVWLYEGVTKSNILSILLFIIVNVIFLGAFVLIFQKAFILINQNMAEKYTKKDFKLLEQNKHSQLISLFIKELKLYTQSSIHMLNTCFGSVSILIFAISTFFYDKSNILEAFSSFGIVIKPEEFVLAICGTMIALSCTTPASISMESKSLWCLRSMPIKETTIFYSKMMVDLCLIMPINIIAAIILGINFGVSLIDMILIVVFMSIVGIATTHFGLILNLLFPKLKFKTEVEVVKQSMAANLAVYIPMTILAINVVIYMIIKQIISFEIFVFILTLIIVLISIILNLILRLYGVNKLRSLYC